MESDFFKHFKKCSVTGKFHIKVDYFQVKDTLIPTLNFKILNMNIHNPLHITMIKTSIFTGLY